MNKKIWWFPVFLFVMGAHLHLLGDWQGEIRRYLSKAHEFDRVAAYLEENLESIPAAERTGAVIILCYAYGQIGDRVNEEKWLGRYFDGYEGGEADDFNLAFLGPRQRLKIFGYIDSWRRSYPRITGIRIGKQSRRIRYFFPPDKIILEIDIQAPAELSITAPQGETVYTDYLQAGRNSVALPFDQSFIQKPRTPLAVLLKAGSIEIKKTAVLAAVCQYPDHVRFDPATGTLTIEGQTFKPETSEETVYKTRRRFDRQYFFKRALLNLGAGGGIFALNRLFIYGPSGSEDRSARSRAVLKGLYTTANIMALGLSLKGIIHIFKSFKKEEIKEVRTIVHPDAAAHNRALREQLTEAGEEVYIDFELEYGGKE
jgi:hypothetical protein